MAAVVLELDEDGVRFRHGAEEREANGQLDTLLDQRASGSLSEENFHWHWLTWSSIIRIILMVMRISAS